MAKPKGAEEEQPPAAPRGAETARPRALRGVPRGGVLCRCRSERARGGHRRAAEFARDPVENARERLVLSKTQKVVSEKLTNQIPALVRAWVRRLLRRFEPSDSSAP